MLDAICEILIYIFSFLTLGDLYIIQRVSHIFMSKAVTSTYKHLNIQVQEGFYLSNQNRMENSNELSIGYQISTTKHLCYFFITKVGIFNI